MIPDYPDEPGNDPWEPQTATENVTEQRHTERQSRGFRWLDRIRRQLTDGLPPTAELDDEPGGWE
jgi:hypothetical protein